MVHGDAGRMRALLIAAGARFLTACGAVPMKASGNCKAGQGKAARIEAKHVL